MTATRRVGRFGTLVSMVGMGGSEAEKLLGGSRSRLVRDRGACPCLQRGISISDCGEYIRRGRITSTRSHKETPAGDRNESPGLAQEALLVDTVA